MKLVALRSLGVASFLGFLSVNSSGYELATHARMTYEAYRRADITTLSLKHFEQMGLLDVFNARQTNPFGRQFYDMYGLEEPVVRFAGNWPPRAYERVIFERARLGADFLSIGGWMSRGGFREDDWPSRDNPGDDRCDPTGQHPCFRVFHHFFDPYNNRPLTVTGAQAIETPIASPHWAIGTEDAFAESPQPNNERRNHFSIFDAREAMFRALTLKKKDTASGTFVDLLAVNASDAARVETQAGYWATMFRALGSVAHHLQDMAQPQHTRNDAHTGFGGRLGESSFFEHYIDNRASGLPMIIPGIGEFIPAALRFDEKDDPNAYPIPSFNNYVDFWTTARGVGAERKAASLAGRGMADYSSRGFYTAGTNIGSAGGSLFDSPPRSAQAQLFSGARDIAGRPVSGSVEIVWGNVQDEASPPHTAHNVMLSSKSAFDEFLIEKGAAPRFALNHYNYDAKAELLVRRAVAYSAGLFNYFFRGRLKISMPADGLFGLEDVSKHALPNSGFKRIKALVQNTTPNVLVTGGAAHSQDTSVAGGQLIAVLKYRLNTCMELPSLIGSARYDASQPTGALWDERCRWPSLRSGQGHILPTMTASRPVELRLGGINGAPQLYIFEFEKAMPFNAIDVGLYVVYRGHLGAEQDGIAVGFETLSEPTFYNFDNFKDCSNDTCKTDPIASGCIVDREAASLPWPGGSPVVYVVKQPAKTSARAAFLTHAGYRNQADEGGWDRPSINQDSGYDIPVVNPLTGTLIETWPKGVKIVEPLHQSRLIEGERYGKAPSLGWPAHPTFSTGYFEGVRNTCGDNLMSPLLHEVIVEPSFWTIPGP